MKDVVTKECQSGQETIFNMELKRSQFLVKNFTSGKIKVTLGNNDTFSTISSGCFENVFNNIFVIVGVCITNTSDSYLFIRCTVIINI